MNVKFVKNHYPGLDFFDQFEIKNCSQKLLFIQHIILRISIHHHRSNQFFQKIERILIYFKTEIISNVTIFQS